MIGTWNMVSTHPRLATLGGGVRDDNPIDGQILRSKLILRRPSAPLGHRNDN